MRRKLVVWALTAIMVMVVIGASIFIPQREVYGTATCESGQQVTGVFVETPIWDHYADIAPTDSQNSVGYTGQVAWLWPHHQLHVGCGGTKEDWTSNNRITIWFGRNTNVTCSTPTGKYYGSCRIE